MCVVANHSSRDRALPPGAALRSSQASQYLLRCPLRRWRICLLQWHKLPDGHCLQEFDGESLEGVDLEFRRLPMALTGSDLINCDCDMSCFLALYILGVTIRSEDVTTLILLILACFVMGSDAQRKVQPYLFFPSTAANGCDHPSPQWLRVPRD